LQKVLDKAQNIWHNKIRKEQGKMGYVGFSKSENAVWAEKNGLKTASQIAKELGVSTKAVKEVLVPSEWHHTGCWYNKTDYYLPPDDEDVERIKAVDKKYKESLTENSYIAKSVEWTEWGGTRRYPKKMRMFFENVQVTEKGDWVYITTPSGREWKKKKDNVKIEK